VSPLRDGGFESPPPPPLLPRILPVVFVDDVRAYVDFLVSAFGFTLDTEWADPGDADHFGFYVEVDDIDTHFAQALAGGATISSPIEAQSWGARMYAARDPEGYGWSFATPGP
jgi:uncharacterized glyoxalase superfamily protein PhnB